MKHNILVVDDQNDIRELISDILGDEGYAVHQAADSHQAMECVKEIIPHVIILDIWLNNSRFDGIELLDYFIKKVPHASIVMISGHANIETAVACLKKGAYDFIEKPFQTERLVSIVRKGIEKAILKQEVDFLRRQTHKLEEITGDNPTIDQLRKNALRVAKTNSRVVIEGKSGVGKSTLARFIHQHSDRAAGPFVSVNCAGASADHLIESLFGIEKEVSPGDVSVTMGAIELAHYGTLLLENLHDMPLDVQSLLLTFLHGGTYKRVNGKRSFQSNVRVISTTLFPLDACLNQGILREDFYYRINVASLYVPQLSQRREDIILLAQAFLKNTLGETRAKDITFAEDVVALMNAYEWPGNVRQLFNVLEWITIMMTDDQKVINMELLPADLKNVPVSMDGALQNVINLPLREARECFERDYLSLQINRFNGNVAKTAQVIGMERTALHRKIKSLNLVDEKD